MIYTNPKRRSPERTTVKTASSTELHANADSFYKHQAASAVGSPRAMSTSSGRKRPLEHSEVEPTSPQALSRRTSSSPRFESPNGNARGSGSSGDGGGGGSSTAAVSNDSDDHDPYGEDSDLFDADDLPNDTMATILSLQKEFYAGRPRLPRNSTSTGAARHPSGGERTGVVLQHQIYTVLENRTAVDLELTSMRKENLLRTFHLGTGREDWGIMSTEHYLRLIFNFLGDTTTQKEGTVSAQPVTSAARSEERSGAPARASTGNGGSGRASPTIAGLSTPAFPSSAKSTEQTSARERCLARDVLERLVLSNTKAYASRKQVSVAMREVLEARRGESEKGMGASSSGSPGGDAAAAAWAGAGVARGRVGRAHGRQLVTDGKGGDNDEQDIPSLKKNEDEVLSLTSKLVRAGFLLPRRDVGREEAYWFSMPQLGKVITSISRGRKDVVGALKRTRYKEIRRAALEAKNPARATGLPLSFHVRDLLGLGMIREMNTPSGTFLRLPSDAS
ncbi:unnamed protein product [Scytosiphon promiscuus]